MSSRTNLLTPLYSNTTTSHQLNRTNNDSKRNSQVTNQVNNNTNNHSMMKDRAQLSTVHLLDNPTTMHGQMRQLAIHHYRHVILLTVLPPCQAFEGQIRMIW